MGSPPRSPVTDRQITRAIEAGFAEVALDTPLLARPETQPKALRQALTLASGWLAEGRSVVFHTARGPDDPRLASTARVLKQQGLRAAATLGTALGELLAAAMQQFGMARGVVTGGDTSGFAAQVLKIEALEFAASIAPGAPLCRVNAPGHAADGREIVFKGGQNGKDDFLVRVLRGGG
jgi:3-oxoisoapionate kinase